MDDDKVYVEDDGKVYVKAESLMAVFSALDDATKDMSAASAFVILHAIRDVITDAIEDIYSKAEQLQEENEE